MCQKLEARLSHLQRLCVYCVNLWHLKLKETHRNSHTHTHGDSQCFGWPNNENTRHVERASGRHYMEHHSPIYYT